MRDGESSVLNDFRSGHPEAFDQAFADLFHQHQRFIYIWLWRIVRNPTAAEDLTIETFWRIYRAHARFDSTREFEPWARAIATHVAIDWMRRRRPEEELPADVPAPPRGDPAISEEIRRKTAAAFARLPPKLRVAAILAVVEERPYQEVADALGISAGAVKLRVFRALRLLRKDLEQQGITP